MRAYGSPAAGDISKLGLVEIDAPSPHAGEVLIRVVAAAVNPADLKVHRGELAGRVLHARTKPLVSGYDVSGVVEACGEGVGDLQPGDEVFGMFAYSSGTKQGSFAERVVMKRGEVAKKPAGVSHATAAAAATSGLSALQSLRDLGRLTSGQRVLVIGASGGVGSIAVGVAKQLGAHVTAVCSTPAIELVRSLGADEIVDRKATDPTTVTGPFDQIFDTAVAYSYAAMRHQLARGGAFLTTLPTAGFVGGKLLSLFSSKRCHMLLVKGKSRDLEQLGAWLATGMKVPIDSTFPIRDLAKALERQGSGKAQGKIVVGVENGF